MKKMIIGLVALCSVSAFADCKVFVEGDVSEKVKVALVEMNYKLTSKFSSDIDYIISEFDIAPQVNFFGVRDYQGDYWKNIHGLDLEKVFKVDGDVLRKSVLSVRGSRMYERDYATLPAISFGSATNKAIRKFVKKLTRCEAESSH